MRFVRILMMAAAFGGLVRFNFVNTASANEVRQAAVNLFDQRPARSILFVGNSRTYPHDLPYMVRRMADSANAPEKYQIRMHALPGQALADHWRNPRAHALLAERWDDVIIQGNSGAHISESDRANFQRFGEQLIEEAAVHGAQPVLFVGWTYGTDADWPAAATAQNHQRIQQDHRRLASHTGAGLANVGSVWRSVQAADPPFRLDTDGNHPSLHGSYVSALVFYAHLAGDDVAKVSYVRPGSPPRMRRCFGVWSARRSSSAGRRLAALALELLRERGFRLIDLPGQLARIDEGVAIARGEARPLGLEVELVGMKAEEGVGAKPAQPRESRPEILGRVRIPAIARERLAGDAEAAGEQHVEGAVVLAHR